MKLKYYLRGLGIGIIVTAVIMGIASGNRKETLSDREIKERAAALGMVEQGSSLADMEAAASSKGQEEPLQTPEMTADAAEEPTAASEAAEEPTAAPEETEEPTAVPEETDEPTDVPEETEEPTAASKDTVTIEIRSGDSSYAVCRKLEAEGLIASAGDFDSYLYTKGYDRKLRIGSYEIPADAKPEEIAKILTHEQ